MKRTCEIIYTWTDESPALASLSLLPLIRFFVGRAGVAVVEKDISLAGRILANFPDFLTYEQRVPDALGELLELVQQERANIIKLPNISASLPQLEEALLELRGRGIPSSPTMQPSPIVIARFWGVRLIRF